MEGLRLTAAFPQCWAGQRTLKRILGTRAHYKKDCRPGTLPLRCFLPYVPRTMLIESLDCSVALVLPVV
jgi:hypothetical protein